MLWLAAMALTPPAPPPPDCSAGVLGDYNCDGCVDLEDRTRRISCMWGELHGAAIVGDAIVGSVHPGP